MVSQFFFPEVPAKNKKLNSEYKTEQYQSEEGKCLDGLHGLHMRLNLDF